MHKALADPRRIAVLEALWQEPQSAKALADKLGLPPDRLYYHLKRLEQAGLIGVDRYHPLPGGKAERIYAAVEAEPDAEPTTVEEKRDFLMAVLEATRLDVHAAMGGGVPTSSVSLQRTLVSLSSRRFEELTRRMSDLLEEYRDDDDLEDTVPTSVTYALVRGLPQQPLRPRAT